MRRLLCEAAHAAVKSTCQFKGLYQGLALRRGKRRAVLAVGHKLLRIMFVLLSKKQPYRDPGVDYEALMVKRNAPRWIKCLAKYGYVPAATGESGP